jgi:hypothetical protein
MPAQPRAVARRLAIIGTSCPPLKSIQFQDSTNYSQILLWATDILNLSVTLESGLLGAMGRHCQP